MNEGYVGAEAAGRQAVAVAVAPERPTTIAIRDGGGFGSIIGRNSFQRAEAAAKQLLAGLMKLFKT